MHVAHQALTLLGECLQLLGLGEPRIVGLECGTLFGDARFEFAIELLVRGLEAMGASGELGGEDGL